MKNPTFPRTILRLLLHLYRMWLRVESFMELQICSWQTTTQQKDTYEKTRVEKLR
jgi:hypothetical protein